MTKAEFARFRAVSRAAVSQWAAAGRIVVTADGKVDVAASVKKLAETGGSSRGGKNGGGVAAARPEERPSFAGERAALNGAQDVTLMRARTAQAAFAAKTSELDYHERTGAIMHRNRVERAIADCLVPSLAILDAASARLAPRLVGQTDLRKIREIIDDELRSACSEIANAADALDAGANGTRQ